MEDTEFEPFDIKGMDKCAVIYRSDSVSFVYVCYHCGSSFADIDCTLQHIESHFQLVQVTIDENYLKSECKDSKNSTNTDLDIDNIRDITDPELNIKTEVMESEEDCGRKSIGKPSAFDCQRCDSIFSSKFSLRSHILRDHFQQQALECKKCGKMFKRIVSLKNHLRQHIEREEVDWNCVGDGIREPSSIDVECTEQSENSTPSTLIEIQPEKRPPKRKNKTSQVRSKQKTRQLSTYVCHKCSETFSSLDNLNGHLNTHSSDDILQINKCTECKSYFRSVFDLRLHVLEVHHSVKKFKCSTCSIEFKKEEKSLLEKHLESHLVNNSVTWTNIGQGICNKGKDVASYEDITTSAKSSCSLCDETFFLKSNFDEHIRCMHSENEHELRCPQCEAVFTKLQVHWLA